VRACHRRLAAAVPQRRLAPWWPTRPMPGNGVPWKNSSHFRQPRAGQAMNSSVQGAALRGRGSSSPRLRHFWCAFIRSPGRSSNRPQRAFLSSAGSRFRRNQSSACLQRVLIRQLMSHGWHPVCPRRFFRGLCRFAAYSPVTGCSPISNPKTSRNQRLLLVSPISLDYWGWDVISGGLA